jgi:hypothetical protein
MSEYRNLPRQVRPAPPVSPPSAGAIETIFGNLKPSTHPALAANGVAGTGGSVTHVADVTALIAALPNQAR